ncbi:MAG: hypothetical protein Q7J10_03905 [Methanosarcinaceae archaeon]|nr:hypothetical protein [Methanosarcinaceae archaeon]
MATEPNHLLEYSIDSLLKVFNPDRKPILYKYHFFKLMNLLDSELKTQGVDIKLPGYWYKYGFYVDLNFLDIVLPRKFTKNYVLNNTIVPAARTRREYKIEPDIKRKVDLAVHRLWNQYGFKSKYGEKAKKDSYEINAPYKFNSIFQDYIETVKRKEVGFTSRKEQLEPLLDNLLNTFSEEDFSELFDVYLEWDDTTRLIIDCISNKEQYDLTNSLMELFWDVYSNGVKIIHNQNIPDDEIIVKWKKSYKASIPILYEQIEDVREGIISKHHETFDENVETVTKLMKCAYEIH